MTIAQRSSTPTWMTLDEFLTWPGDGSGRKFQLVDGEPTESSRASGPT